MSQMSPLALDTKPKGGRFRLIKTLLLFGVSLLAVSSVTTQYLAWQLGYASFLSGHWDHGFYTPWSGFVWSHQLWETHQTLIQQAMILFSIGLAGCFVVYALGLVFLGRRAKAVKGLHGTAEWAKRKNIIECGLLPNPKSKPKKKSAEEQEKENQKEGGGVYVGGWKDEKTGQVHYLQHRGPEHVLAFAPTRSGKGVGLVLPTLLSWRASLLCYDIKGENWALTAGWRREHAGNIVMKFDPASNDGSSIGFNPLAEIRLHTERDVADTQNLASMIVDPNGKGLEDHWAKTSHALITACILHCCYEQAFHKKQANLADVGNLLANPKRNTAKTLAHMLAYPHLEKNTRVHPVVAAEARSIMNMAEKEQSSVISSAVSFLTLYRDPIVRRNTAHSDFKISDLMNHKKPVSLYLVVRPSDSERLRPLIRLMITQIVRSLTETMQFKKGRAAGIYHHRLLLMLDEFASLKKLSAIEDGLAFMAGYGLKAYLIVQDLQQITREYSREEGLIGNCHVRIAYAPNKVDTAELLSKMSGTTTIIKENISVSGDRYDLVMGNMSKSMQEIQRPLLTADEAMRLPAPRKDAQGKILEAGHMLIFTAGFPPIYGQQILYFLDQTFLARAQVTAPDSSDHIQPPPAAPEKTSVNATPNDPEGGTETAPTDPDAPDRPVANKAKEAPLAPSEGAESAEVIPIQAEPEALPLKRQPVEPIAATILDQAHSL